MSNSKSNSPTVGLSLKKSSAGLFGAERKDEMGTALSAKKVWLSKGLDSQKK
jgi:hypothetical protein